MGKIFYNSIKVIKSLSLALLLFVLVQTDCLSETPSTNEKVILVFDASGSMWGQIGGKNKIEIAREAVGSLISDWPESKEIGLMAYGHREKGDCNDIEMLIPVGKLDKNNFKSTISKISPKGKTPLSEAVKRAANELRFTEEKATVVLLSDGIETCDLDPCEIGKTLEAQGIDFTAHVIGFDVNKVEDQKGLKCLAENTGGKFIAAKDAKELKEALETTVKAPEPTLTPTPMPSPTPVVLPVATITAPAEAIKGTEIETKNISESPLEETGYVYLIKQGKEKDSGYGLVHKSDTGNEMYSKIRLPILIGQYDLVWKINHDSIIAKTTINVIDAPVVINGPAEAVAGTEVKLDIDAPRGLTGYVYLYKKGSDKQISYEIVHEGSASNYEQIKFRLPSQTGDYVFKFKSGSEEVVAEKEIKLTDVKVEIVAAAEGIAGTEITLDLNGPPGLAGYVYIYKKGSDKQISYEIVREGTSTNYEQMKFRLPAVQGDFTFKYKSVAGEVLAEKEIKLTEAKVTLETPLEAVAGTVTPVDLKAPPGLAGYVYIYRVGSDKQISYEIIREGNSENYEQIKFRLPATAGEYVFKFKTVAGEVLAEQAVKLTNTQVKIVAPAEAIAGTEIVVNLDASPGLDGYVYLYKKGSDKQISYEKVREGSISDYETVNFRLPATSGDYVFKFKTIAREELAEQEIKLTQVNVKIISQPEGLAGEEFPLDIEAPPGLSGYVYLYKKGSDKQVSYQRLREGKSFNYEIVKFKLPETPGEYVFKLKAMSKEVLAETNLVIK